MGREDDFAEALGAARIARGWSFRDFEKHVPFSYAQLNRMEKARRNPPDRESVISIAAGIAKGLPTQDAITIANDLLRAARYALLGPHEYILVAGDLFNWNTVNLDHMFVDRYNQSDQSSLPANPRHPPTPDEASTIAAANEMRMRYPQLEDPAFWAQTPREREGAFMALRILIEHTRALKASAEQAASVPPANRAPPTKPGPRSLLDASTSQAEAARQAESDAGQASRRPRPLLDGDTILGVLLGVVAPLHWPRHLVHVQEGRDAFAAPTCWPAAPRATTEQWEDARARRARGRRGR